MNNNKPMYSLDAERSVIGAILLDQAVVELATESLCADDFFRPEHRLIFSSIVSLIDSCEPVDVVTISEWLAKHNELDNIGGIPYLLEISEATPSASNAASYIQIVKEHSTVRDVFSAASKIATRSHDRDGMTSEEIVEEAESLISKIGDSQTKEGEFESVGELLKVAINRIDELYNNGETITGLKTGLEDLDEKTCGLQDTDLIIIAGRPAMGKSTLAINIAEHAAINEKKTVAVFSLEMPSSQLTTRMLSSVGRIDQNRLRTGKLENGDWDKLMLATKLLKDANLMINDTASISPSYIRSKLTKIKRDKGSVDLVVIDYLQLMKIKGYKGDRTGEVSEISRALKAIAKEFECPVIALSQLNRSLENRPNKRPINSDLRESGAIEQDADIIAFVYRDEVYNPDTPDKGIGEVIIGKHRNGEIGTIRTSFLGKYARFENLMADNFMNGQY